MRKNYTLVKRLFTLCLFAGIIPLQLSAQCPPITVSATDTAICAGDSTTLTINTTVPDTGNIMTPVINNNGQDGNMFNITAGASDITIRYFEGNIANTPNATTDYYMYYKVGTHVGFESNAAAWTLIAGNLLFNPNTPNTFTRIPFFVNITIPAGQTYAFYLTNTSAITNNNRYHNGTSTGAVLTSNTDMTIFEGTGGAYPFGTFFNARPWEGRIIYSKAVGYSWNTGPTTQSITVAPGSSTSYIGSAMYNLLGCQSFDTLLVNVSAGGSTLNLGADTTLCQDTLTLDAGSGVMNYSWSTGDTTQTVDVTSTGTYSASVMDSIGCIVEDTIVVTMNPLPLVDVGPDITRCENAPCSPLSAIVTGAPGPFSYLWSPATGLDNAVIANPCANPSSPTTYFLQVQSGDGCVNLADSQSTVTVNVQAAPVVQLGSDTSFCAGGNVQLDAGAGFTGYAWSPSGSTQTITVSSAGAYSVTVTDGAGCMGADTITVSEDQAPVAAFTDAPSGLVVTFTNTSTGGGSYFWDFGDGQTSTAANPVHTYSSGGTFVVMLIVTNACGSDTTTVTITLTGLENAGAAHVHVFPNPNQGVFKLQVQGWRTDRAELGICSVLGAVVYEASLDVLNGSLDMEMQLSDIAKGVYFLRLTADGETVVKKLVIR